MELLEATKDDRNFSEELRNNIVAYFNGEIKFKKLGLGEDTICNSWYLRKYTSSLKNPLEISSDKKVLKRVFRVYFYLMGKNQVISKFLRIDFKKIIEIYPELYKEYFDKSELIKDVIIEFFNRNPNNAKNLLLEKFERKDILKVLDKNKKLKTGGYYNFSRNIYCVFLMDEIRQSYENKDFGEMKDLSIKYIKRLADDYLIGLSYIAEGNTNGSEIRRSLSSKESSALLTLIKSGKNWEENIEILENYFFRLKVGNYLRPVYAFIEHDKDFISFFDYIKNINVANEKLKFVNRIRKLILDLRPNFYISKLYFEESEKYGARENVDESLNKLESLMKEHENLKRPLLKYFVNYTVENFSSNFIVHSKAMELLVTKYGLDSIMNHFKVRTQKDYVTGIYLISKFAQSRELKMVEVSIYNMLLDNFLEKAAKDNSSIMNLKNYILGLSDSVDIQNSLKTSITSIGIFSEWYIFRGQSLERLVEICLGSNNRSLVKMLILYFIRCEEEFPHQYLLDLVMKLNINIDTFVKEYIVYAEYFGKGYSEKGTYYFRNNYYKNDIFAAGLKYLEDGNVDCLQIGEKLSPNLKKVLVEGVFYEGKVKREASFLVDYLNEKQKAVLEVFMDKLKNLDESVVSEVEEKIYKEIKKYPMQKEIMAVEVLCHYGKDKERLKKLYIEVKDAKSRELISAKLELDLKDMYKDVNGDFDLDNYLDNVYKKQKKSPMELDKLILPKRKDGKDAERAVEHLLLSYKTSDEFTISKEALVIAECFTKESMTEFAKSIFINWINSKMDTKTKWQLLIPIIHGDYELVCQIEKFIEKLAGNSRQKLAVYLLKAIGLNGTREAFVIIDKISRRTKVKSLREAGSEAFEIAADQLGITKGELGDQLVGDMGFVDGYIPLDYGNRIMKLYVGKGMKFEIENENGKIYKSLPKGTKDDDEEKVEEAKGKFKILKKELRDMVKLQSSRLEDALGEWRIWKSEKWQALFLNNPIMNILGKSLLWGIYEEERLIKTFAFDTEIFDIDYEDWELKKDDRIGIVHPLELEAEELRRWKEIFEESEIMMLFGQLDREILGARDKEVLEFTPIDFPRKSPSTFINRLRKKGWNIGSVRDAGSFNEIYKEIKGWNIGIEATFTDDLFVGGYGYEVYHSDDGLIGIEKVEFYRLGKISRESYDYDELENYRDLRYKTSELPERIVSELLFELKSALT